MESAMIERVDTSKVSDTMVNWSDSLTSVLPSIVVSSVHEEIAIVIIAIPINTIFLIMLYLLVEVFISIGKVLTRIGQRGDIVVLCVFYQFLINTLVGGNHAITIVDS